MTPQERLHFIRQLHHWSEALIEVGRYPFRRAETFPPVLTASGLVSPPLVLWINRQSLQAGGIIFLAENDENPDDFAHYAQALGITYFILWTPRRLSLWEQPNRSQPVQLSWQSSAPRQQQLHDFQLLLTEVFDQFRRRVVLGTVDDADLPADYFATLCYHALLTIRQPLLETLRIARGSAAVPPELQPVHMAFAWALTLLLRVLAQRADEQRLAGPNVEQGTADERLPYGESPQLPVPEQVETTLRQLDHRLRQLHWGTDALLAAATVDCLTRQLAPLFNCTACELTPPEAKEKRLFVNHSAPAPTDTCIIPAPLHDAMALSQQLKGEENASLLTLAELSSDAFNSIVATLPRQPFSSLTFREEQGRVLLRKLWPNRRFVLPPQSPSWVYHGLALFAATGNDGKLVIELPQEWLDPQTAPLFIEIIHRHYQLSELRVVPRQRHQLRLHRKIADTVLIVTSHYGQRPLTVDTEQPLTASRLRLALNTPPPLWKAIASRQLTPLAETGDQRLALSKEIARFRASRCGEFLTTCLDAADQLPFPPHELLALFATATGSTELERAQRDLEVRLGIDQLDWAALQQPEGRDVTRRRLPRLPRAKVFEELQLTALTEGVPRFPEQYLYDYFKPRLNHYTFKGPLRHQGDFFGRIQLSDEHGNVIEVDHVTLAVALQLASQLTTEETFLPADPEILATIIKRYLADLTALRGRLHDLAHRHITDQRQANRLVNDVWTELPLPPLDLLDKIGSID